MSACSVCSSRHVGAIETALASGESKSAIGRRYDVSRFAIARHAEHTVEGVLVEANRPVLEGRLHDLDARLVGLEAVLQRTLDQAIAAGKATTLVATARELRMTIESIAKLRGQLDERPVVNVALLPEFRAVTSRLLAALADYPEARFAAAKALAGPVAIVDAHCPEGEGDAPSDQAGERPVLEAPRGERPDDADDDGNRDRPADRIFVQGELPPVAREVHEDGSHGERHAPPQDRERPLIDTVAVRDEIQDADDQPDQLRRFVAAHAAEDDAG